ncbi:MAG: RNA polymerase sigma factor [Candidatus Limnocylindrales bacterium]
MKVVGEDALSSIPRPDVPLRGVQTAEARFRSLVAGELDRAYRLAGLLMGNAADAEDATQEALLRAWSSLGALRDPAGFQAWFDRILVNVCRDRMRRRKRIQFIDLDGSEDRGPAGDPFAAFIEHDAILRAMTGMREECRQVVVLHYWADLPLAEIGSRLGLPLGTVKSRLSEGREHMRESAARSADGKRG